MKPLLLLFIPVAFAGCMLHGQQDPQQAAILKQFRPVFTQQREVDGEKARKMYDNFKNADFKKFGSYYAEFNREELIRILQNSDQPNVKLLVGAYFEDEGSGNGRKERRQPTILVQTAKSEPRSSKAAYQRVAYHYFEGITLCPPPSPCDVEQ